MVLGGMMRNVCFLVVYLFIYCPGVFFVCVRQLLVNDLGEYCLSCFAPQGLGGEKKE